MTRGERRILKYKKGFVTAREKLGRYLRVNGIDPRQPIHHKVLEDVGLTGFQIHCLAGPVIKTTKMIEMHEETSLRRRLRAKVEKGEAMDHEIRFFERMRPTLPIPTKHFILTDEFIESVENANIL